MRWILQLLVRFFCLDPVFSAHPARALIGGRITTAVLAAPE